MYRFKIWPEVSQFFREHRVKLPNRWGQRASFVNEQIRRLNDLIDEATDPDDAEDDVIREGLLHAKKAWLSVHPDQDKPELEDDATQAFHAICMDYQIKPPDLSASKRTAEVQSKLCLAAASEADPDVRPRLERWRRDWQIIARSRDLQAWEKEERAKISTTRSPRKHVRERSLSR